MSAAPPASPVRDDPSVDGMAFSPWHGLAAHRPLGSVMRARRTADAMSARFRAERTGRSVAEPNGTGARP